MLLFTLILRPVAMIGSFGKIASLRLGFNQMIHMTKTSIQYHHLSEFLWHLTLLRYTVIPKALHVYKRLYSLLFASKITYSAYRSNTLKYMYVLHQNNQSKRLLLHQPSKICLALLFISHPCCPVLGLTILSSDFMYIYYLSVVSVPICKYAIIRFYKANANTRDIWYY